MQRGAEVRPEAEVANVGVGALVQLLQGVEARADAAPVTKADGKWPGDDDLIADVFVDHAALRHDRSRDVGDETVEKIEEAGLAETLGDSGRGLHIDEQQHALLDAGPTIAAGDEIKQYALAEQVVHPVEEVEAEAQDEREDDAAALDQGFALGGFPHEPRTDNETHENRGKIPQRTQREIKQEWHSAGQRAARPAKDGKFE
jgi:hypothetical protein